MTAALWITVVVLAAALICVCLAAYDMIRQLCEDLDDAQAERDALLVVTDEQEADLATYRRNAIRPVGETPVFDLLAARKKAFDRDLDRANQLTHYRPEDWNNWGTDNGDAS